MFDKEGFLKIGLSKKRPNKSVKKNSILKDNYDLDDIVEKEAKEILNLKTQNPDEIFYLQDTSVSNGYSITNIERLLKINIIQKIDDFGYKFDYFERIYTYCFDLVHNGKFVKYYEIIAKDLPDVRKIVKTYIHNDDDDETT